MPRNTYPPIWSMVVPPPNHTISLTLM